LSIQPGAGLNKALSSLPENGYEDTLVPCSPQPGPTRVRLTTAAGTLPVRLTWQVRPARTLPARMGTPNRRNISGTRPGSPGPIPSRFAPKPDAVWKEDNGRS
jgi:hypothetical protein